MEINFTKEELKAFEKEVRQTLESIEGTMKQLEQGLKINRLILQSIIEWKQKH